MTQGKAIRLAETDSRALWFGGYFYSSERVVFFYENETIA
jgi:hypothetical protein